MRNKRNIIIILSLLATLAVVIVFFLSKEQEKPIDSNQRPELPTAPIQTEEELKTVENSLESFKEIMLASNSKDYAKTIELAKVYGQNGSNGKTERMNAYVLCLGAGRELTDDVNLNDCEAQLMTLVQTLDPDGVALWEKLIEATKQGKALESANQDQQIQ